MAFDEGLAERIREVFGARRGLTEKRMFGGIAFLLDGRMTVGIVKDALMVRVGKARHAASLTEPHVRPMDFTGRPMSGFVYVDPEGIAEDAALERWIALALDVTREEADAPRRETSRAKAKSPAAKKPAAARSDRRR